MKRTLSLLLALVMTLSLFPAGIAAAADPADVTVQAYQLAGNRLIEVDGSTDEVYWLLDTYVGSSMLGVLCDLQKVYFAFKTTASTAKFTVNGVTVDCTLGAAPKASVGTIAAKNGTYELAVPVSDLKLEIVPDKTVDFAAVLGADSVKGALVLAQVNVFAVGDGITLTGADYAASLAAASFGDGNITVTPDGVMTFKNDGDSYYTCASKANSPWGALSSKGYMMAFEADFNDLPVSTDDSKLMYNFGLFWFLRAGDARSDMAFWADENGQIMFCAKQKTTAESRKNALPTGIYLGTPQAQNVRVRILLDQSNNITLYLNGVKIGSLAACPPPSTSARNQLTFYTDHRKRTTADAVDVVLSDLSYREFSVAEAKDPEDRVLYPTPVGPGMKDIEAFLKNGALKIDGTTKEAQWYLNHKPEHRTGDDAPSIAFGLVWDKDYLYLAMQDFGKQTARQVSLTVNNKVMVSADLVAGTATAGEIYYDPYTYCAEWAIPMPAIGLKGQFNEVAPYSVAVSSPGGISVLSGNLTLGGNAVLMGDTFDDMATRAYTVTGTAPGTQLFQGDGSANYVSDPDLAGNEIHQMFKALDFDGAAYTLEVDVTFQSLPAIGASLGWRGLCFELREPKLQSRFNFRDDGNGKVIMDILYGGNGVVSHDTGIKIGERAVVRIEVDKNEVPVLYVNGKEVVKYPAQNRTTFTINDSYPMPRLIIQAVNYNRIPDSAGNLNEVNVQLHDMLFFQPTLADTQSRLDMALSQLTEKIILGKNTGADSITTALNLPARVAVSDALSYPVTWTLCNPDGTPAKVIDLATGKTTPNATTSMVVLTATISEGAYKAERSFQLQIKGAQANKNVYFLPGDDAPATGAIGKPAVDEFVLFDTNHNSVVLDQGSAKRFNRVTLYDSDEVSRVSQNDLGVFISNDGKNYTKVTGWLLHQSGKVYTLYNLDETARYVKVHSYQDGLNDEGDPTQFDPSFQNNVADLIRVEYSDSQLGAKGKFAHTGTYTVSNVTDKELWDEIVYITLEQLGAKAGQYRSDCADFRFAVDGVQQPHWYDGEGGFYVRVLKVPAKGSATVTAQWGNVTAADVSDREAVFEAVYGNASLIDLTEKTDLVNSGRAFTFPDGSVVAVSRNDDSELTAVFSYDGGRTFTPVGVDLIPDNHYANTSGYGSFIWDPNSGTKGRLILMAYMPKSATSNGYEKADCRFVMLYTDDYGKTWSEPRVLSDAAAKPATDNDIVIQNSKGRFYQLSYCDGLTLKDADGDGPNVDYVLSHSYFRPDGTFSGCALFSKDGGKNWIASEGEITMETTIAHENGISETAFAQLDDGSLYIVARAQATGNLYFYESWSYDYGNTWTTAKPSPVISTNTSPVFLPYGSDRLLMWAGHNTLSATSRRRFPLTLAISSDNYASYDRSLDLTLGTSFDTLDDGIERITQPSLSVSPDGNEAFACWTNLRQSSSVGILFEEFDEMIYRTKGAYDAFESTSIKGEGWLHGDHTTITGEVFAAGRADVTDEQANSGSQSMKLVDDSNVSRPAYVLRQIPSMQKGTIGISLMVPSDNTTDYAFEIKHAYNYTWGEFTVAGFAVKPDGTVYLCDGKDTVVGKVAPNSWNDYAIEFDMLGSKKGTLYINDKETATFDLIILDNRVTVVEVGERAGGTTVDSCVYVDDFYATEIQMKHNGVRTPVTKSAEVAVGFDDVASDDWCAEAVAYVTGKGLMSGYNVTTFGANDTLTRAQVVQVLYNKEGTPALNGATHKFPDVPANQWFNNAVTWGAAKKVVSGYGDGRFGPNDTVTLEQAVVILWNYSGTPAAEASLDAIGAHSDWASNALRWAVKTGLLEGMPYAAVTGGATRAQTAQLLMNYLSK